MIFRLFSRLFVLCALFWPLVAHAQIPACTGPANQGASYETCTSGVCEKFVCNGTSFSALEVWDQDGTRNVDFGNDTSTCTTQRTGRMRYTGSNVWEYCNGVSWTSFSGAGVTLPINGNNAVLPQGRIVGIGSLPQRNFLSYAGVRNTFLGDNAGGGILSGTDNTFLGYNAGDATTLGSNNIYIGSSTGGLNILSSHNLLIGNGLDAPTLLVSSYLNIANVISGMMANNGSNTSTSDNSASLAIDGSLKLGTSTETCNSGNGGRMRYNSGTKKMQFCNETAWTDM